MKKNLVSINDLPPAGKDFIIDDQDVWLEPILEYKMDCSITSPLKMDAFVMATDEGCLVRGNLKGKITVPCNRCAEDAIIDIDASFDEYEEIPNSPRQKEPDSPIVFERNAPMLDLNAVAWEQLMLAMPPNPICKPDCKGLCSHCGTNLNQESCSCAKDEGDPRMAALRGLSIQKEKK